MSAVVYPTLTAQGKYSANPRRESGDYVELRHAHSKTLARSPERENGPDRHGVRRWSQRNRRFPFRVRRIHTELSDFVATIL